MSDTSLAPPDVLTASAKMIGMIVVRKARRAIRTSGGHFAPERLFKNLTPSETRAVIRYLGEQTIRVERPRRPGRFDDYIIRHEPANEGELKFAIVRLSLR